IHVTAAFLPLLRRQSAARIIHVSSGLAFVPLASAPVYSATKAAVHSFALSLRKQLAGTAVLVIELIPPLVETNLNRDHATKSPGSMPLDDFITASMRALDSGREELPIGLAKVLSVASRAALGLFMRIVNKPR
ncbi:MAG: SDR family NAD(P)-dependent oxidoreductase, partial [Chitinophagales bacterium]|nr:SDR family NAD(P)-dependent oxidoreductase [Hyphomicrobiales bacterium]